MQLEVRNSTPEPDSLAERRRAWLERSRLYLICEAKPAGREPEEILRPALQAGVDVVQLRDKGDGGREVVEAGEVFRRLCDAYDALFIVNDQAELAVACGADGIHLGQDDVSPGEVRLLIGPDALIGLSTHSGAQIAAARDVDYISVGPVYRTPTKPDYEPVGVELVRVAVKQAAVPFFAIGGIDGANVHETLEAGAERIAVVRAIRDASDPGQAARELKERIDAGLGIGSRQ